VKMRCCRVWGSFNLVLLEVLFLGTCFGLSQAAALANPDDRGIYVCDAFGNEVKVIDKSVAEEAARIRVRRDPVSAAIIRDGRFLLVANHLPSGRADQEEVAAVVSVIDTSARKVVKEIQLLNGSGSLNDLKVSPDGKHAVVTHLLARFKQPTGHIYRGWMHSNALTIIDLARMEIHTTLLLDDPDEGAANPWGVAWTADGHYLAVAHAGTHEVSIIDFPKMLARVPSLDSIKAHPPMLDVAITNSEPRDISKELPYVTPYRVRVKLPEGDLGPREVAAVGNTIYVTNYFSQTVSVIDLAVTPWSVTSIPAARGGRKENVATSVQTNGRAGALARMSLEKRGEFYFHDATICLHGWQSCSSCHPGDARADGFNWDLLNDGVGNPKNTKSLLCCFQTPPMMSLGVREDAAEAIRAGMKHILFAKPDEQIATAIGAYLKSLKPVPSPYLENGKLSAAAKRGKKEFSKAGCITCHPPKLFTDLHQYDVGTAREFDKPSDRFDTPTLVEIWRTAPYLHDGSAATVRDVLTTRNPHDRHGRTSRLSPKELDDLCAYLLSL
jgi:YVTN family beta-propeller protein